jgi:hypothetical protein
MAPAFSRSDAVGTENDAIMKFLTPVSYLILGFALALAWTGCNDSDKTDTAASASAPSKMANAPAASGSQGESAPSGKQLTSQPAAQQQGQDKRMEMMKKRMEMMKKQQAMKKKAFAAAEKAEAKGGSSCEKAYHAAVAVNASMRNQLGRDPKEAPEQGAFVSTCQALPETMRQCLVPSYAGAHQEECAEAHKTAKPEVKGKLKTLMAQLR